MTPSAGLSEQQGVPHLIDTAVDIPFRDQRTYLHGTDIYRAIVSCLQPFLEPAFDRFRLKFRTFAGRAVRIVAFRKEQRRGRLEGAASFSLSSASDPSLTISGSILETGDPVRERAPSAEQDVIGRCSVVGDRASLRGPHGFSPIDALVFSTKALHQTRFPTRKGKWIFAALDTPRLLLPEDAEELEVSILSIVRDRFTECSVRARGHDLGTISFSIAV